MRTLKFFLILFLLAFTASAGTVFVGIEDIGLPGGDKDYNDMFLTLTGNDLSVVGNAPGAWQPMVTPNNDGSPFWDNLSWDGAGGYNAGYFVTGTGAFSGNPSSPNLAVSSTQYWGNGTTADSSFLFTMTGGATAEILIEVAAWSGQNQLYWFNQSSPGSYSLLFGGSAGAGASASFTPSGDFGLKISSPSGYFRTTGDGDQYALFRENPVPEPATFLMLGTGLLGLAVIGRRRHQQRR